jgi:tetratricopeptide (TPR) repeat protein
MALARLGDIAGAKTLLEQELKRSGASPAERAHLLEFMAVGCCYSGAFEEGLRYADESLKVEGEIPPVDRANTHNVRGWALNALGRHKETIASADAALALARKLPLPSPWLVAQALRLKGDAKRLAGDLAGAELLLLESLASDPLFETSHCLMSVALAQKQMGKATRAWFLGCLDVSVSRDQLAFLRSELLKGADAKELPDHGSLLALRSEILPRLGARIEVVEEVQRTMIEVLQARGEKEAALVEAKTLLLACGEKAAPDAIRLVAGLLKEIDGNMGRAAAFLERIRGGQGSAQDGAVADPLPDVTLGQAVEERAAFDAALKGAPEDWEGHFARSTIYRCWGKPREALRELNAAMRLAPMEKLPLQAILDATTQVLLQFGGGQSLADRFLAFQRCGVPGPDGKRGTADDLADPMADLLK